ncbi:putative motility protein [Psychrobacillus psychrotolerans]|uniref:putative motility protein n=1 Tax=Psychrobacillus psychrotolerans TaxID=126156 RepID=UPI003B01A86B
MDIALLSMVMSQQNVMQQAMGSTEQQGDTFNTTDVAAIQQAAQPHLGGNIDLKL